MADLRVNWRERDLGTLRAEIQADQGVRRVLARFGVLKFLEKKVRPGMQVSGQKLRPGLEMG